MIRCKSIKIHQKEIALLQEQMRHCKEKIALHPSKNPSNTLRNSDFKKNMKMINISHLNRVLHIDLEKKLVTVEPKITIKALTYFLLKYNLMIAVVPEFDSITIGGAIMGASLESSSHRYGQLNDLCIEYELILGDGTLLKATQQENSDLFYAIGGSYGTLAMLTAVKLRVVEAKKYVHITYKRFWDYHNLITYLSSPTKDDFIEGILLSKSWGVAIEGSLTNHLPQIPMNKQGRFYKPWFYQHIKEVTKKSFYEEVMPLEDYLFRFDRGAFWMGKFVGKLKFIMKIIFNIKVMTLAKSLKKRKKKNDRSDGPSFCFRSLFAPFFSSKYLYKVWHKVPNEISENLFFIQDFYTPLSQTETILKKCMDSTEIFPIWLCPIKNTTQGQFLSPHYNEERMINIGLYGMAKTKVPIPLLTEKLEKTLYASGGKKMLYSYTYYEETLFAKIYDSKSYQKLRNKYRATESFLDLYDKVINRKK